MKRSLQDITQDCSIDDALGNTCIFIPDDQAQGTFASLMYNRSLDHVGVYMLFLTNSGRCFGVDGQHAFESSEPNPLNNAVPNNKRTSCLNWGYGSI